MRLLLMAIALTITLPSLALGATVGKWTSPCGDSNTNAVKAGRTACWAPTAAVTDDSPFLAIDTCDHVDIQLFRDFVGGTTDSTTTYTIRVCQNTSVSDANVTDACPLMDGVGAGITVVSGGPTVGFLKIDSNADGDDSENSKWVVKCN